MNASDPKRPIPLAPHEVGTYAAMIANDLRTHGPTSREAVLHRLHHRWGLHDAEAEGVVASALSSGVLETEDDGRLRAGPRQPLPSVPWASPSKSGKRYRLKKP